ncbi:TRAP transporter small permease [Ruegeria sp. SCP11]|uniref:TRAP transporter small permease n=1 Tax=Ruegeria sp. SCP11 TaxID=3141378 RepID=UPI00333B8949
MHWKIFDRLSDFVILLGGISLVGLIGIMGYQVWGRYVLNSTPTWAESLALLLILMVSLPIAAIGLRENFHLGLDFLTERLPHPVQSTLRIFNTVVLLLFGAAMTWHSIGLVTGTWNRDIPLIGLPQGVKYLPLVFCGILIVLFMIERLAGLVFGGGTIGEDISEEGN